MRKMTETETMNTNGGLAGLTIGLFVGFGIVLVGFFRAMVGMYDTAMRDLNRSYRR